MAGASLLGLTDQDALECRRLELLDADGRVALRLYGESATPEIRFFLRDGPGSEARITSTPEGLVIRVGSSEPLLLGRTRHEGGRQTLGLHVGDDHEVSLDISEGRAGLTL
jgi:hypothetical protein